MEDPDDFEREFRRRYAEAKVAYEPDFVFMPWFMRLLLGVGLCLIAVLIAVVFLLLSFQDTIGQARQDIDRTAASSSAVEEAAYKNRAAQCEVIATLKAPIPPSCLEPRVVWNLPAEMQKVSPFNGQPQ